MAWCVLRRRPWPGGGGAAGASGAHLTVSSMPPLSNSRFCSATRRAKRLREVACGAGRAGRRQGRPVGGSKQHVRTAWRVKQVEAPRCTGPAAAPGCRCCKAGRPACGAAQRGGGSRRARAAPCHPPPPAAGGRCSRLHTPAAPPAAPASAHPAAAATAPPPRPCCPRRSCRCPAAGVHPVSGRASSAAAAAAAGGGGGLDWPPRLAGGRLPTIYRRPFEAPRRRRGRKRAEQEGRGGAVGLPARGLPWAAWTRCGCAMAHRGRWAAAMGANSGVACGVPGPASCALAPPPRSLFVCSLHRTSEDAR